jgi:hypothetical protein
MVKVMLNLASSFRFYAKKIPGVKPLYYRLQSLLDDGSETLDIMRLRTAATKNPCTGLKLPVIVSLTSFPARINHAWIPIETMFQQDHPPSKVVLVLSEEEFPTKALPSRILQQRKRGLEIIWTKHNIRSYKKLLPTRMRYPDANIVTIDDDIFYEPWRLSQLMKAASDRPGAIIGHRGWEIVINNGQLTPYVKWPAAAQTTNTGRIFLTSGGGTLYPPNPLLLDLLLDIDLAQRLCPTGDDIWFWAVAFKAGIPMYCLGNNGLRNIRRLRGSPTLMKTNRFHVKNDEQLNAVINYFGLLERLNNSCY